MGIISGVGPVSADAMSGTEGGAVPQGSEWIIVGLVVLLLFGASQIPRLARSVGSARREYSRGLTEGSSAEDVDRQ